MFKQLKQTEKFYICPLLRLSMFQKKSKRTLMYLAKQKTIDPKPRAMQPRVLSENFERHGKKMMPFALEEADKNI